MGFEGLGYLWVGGGGLWILVWIDCGLAVRWRLVDFGLDRLWIGGDRFVDFSLDRWWWVCFGFFFLSKEFGLV